SFLLFFFRATSSPASYPLSLHDALPIFVKDLERTMQELQISYNAQDEYNRFMTEIEHNEAEIERLEQHLNECLQRADKLQSALEDRKSTRLNSSHVSISYAVFCLKKKK